MILQDFIIFKKFSIKLFSQIKEVKTKFKLIFLK